MIQQRFEIPDHAFARGMTAAVWPARLQQMTSPESLLPGWEIWLDGGHNDSAALVLAEQASRWKEADGKKLHIVTGMMEHKDAEAFARPLAPLAAEVICIPLEKGYLPDALAGIWRSSGASSVRTPGETGSWPAILRDIIKAGDGGR